MSTTDKDLTRQADLLASLREAVDYATMAGLMKDASALTVLATAEAAQKRDEQPDFKSVSEALNSMVALIAPLTLADLHFDRNPLSPVNQSRSRKFQFWLPVLAVVLLVMIGDFMQALRQEKAFIARVEKVQEQNPDQKVSVLLQLMLVDTAPGPSKQNDTMQEQFLAKRAELQRLTSELTSLDSEARLVITQNAEIRQVGEAIVVFAMKRLASSIQAMWSPPRAVAPSAASPPQAASAVQPAPKAKSQQKGSAPGFCQASKNGDLILPPDWLNWPPWMQRMAADDLRSYCFKTQLQSGSAGTQASAVSLDVNVPQLTLVSALLKDRVALHSEWILPFLYGLLGSMLFVMRAVGNIRLPAMQAMSILMRIALGGMAGIVVGWFSIGDPGAQPQITSAIAWPFVLAFVIGYGIEALFSILDRMNSFIADTTYSKSDGITSGR